MTVFPNPAEERVHHRIARQHLHLTVLDLAGRTVLTRSAIGGQAPVDISALPAGAYALRVATRDGRMLRSHLVKY